MGSSTPGYALADLRTGSVSRARSHSPWVEAWIQLVRTKPLGTLGLAILLATGMAAALADVIAPYSPIEQHLIDKLKSPNATYLLGTDQFGRDILSRLIFGARVSLAVGVGSVAIGTAVAVFLGLVSGYAGGTADLILQRFVDAFMSIPGLLLLLAIMSTVQTPGVQHLVIALAIRLAFVNTRVVRSAVVSVKELQYIEAARVVGASTGRILISHILPNIFAPIMVIATISLGQAIFSEAALSFLGFGIAPPTPTWGNMLSRQGNPYMIIAPWTAVFPGLTLTLVIFGVNMLGDAMRDIFDPRLRGANLR